MKAGVPRGDGAWEREYSGGIVIYRPAGGSKVTVNFDVPYRSRASGPLSTTYTVNVNDGDIFCATRACSV